MKGVLVLYKKIIDFQVGMKELKFTQELTNLILVGEKTTTWRLFDEKDLQIGDHIILSTKETGDTFGHANITSLIEKPFKDLRSEDWQGHEKFSSNEEMYETYSGYYNTCVDENTLVKIIHFELIKYEK